MLTDIINKRNYYKDQLYNPTIRFIYKYMVKTFKNEKGGTDITQKIHKTKLYKKFQKILLEIPYWPDDDIDKQFKRFTKWASREYDVNQIEDSLKHIIRLSIQIIVNKNDTYVDKVLEDYKYPDLKYFFYKCLKVIARKMYEHPNEIYTFSTYDLYQEIDKVLQKLLPIDKTKLFIKEDVYTQNGHSKQQNKITYDFEKKSSTPPPSSPQIKNEKSKSKSKSDRVQSKHKEHLKIKNQKQLNYVSSDIMDFEKSDNEIDQHISDNMKYINIPKYNKFNKNNVDEVNQNFFD